jgi:hypothetical protein
MPVYFGFGIECGRRFNFGSLNQQQQWNVDGRNFLPTWAIWPILWHYYQSSDFNFNRHFFGAGGTTWAGFQIYT